MSTGAWHRQYIVQSHENGSPSPEKRSIDSCTMAPSTGVNIARGKSLQQSFQDNLKIAGSELVSRAMYSFSQPRKRQASPCSDRLHPVATGSTL